VEAITSPTVEMPQEVSTDNTSEKTSVVATTVESLPLKGTFEGVTPKKAQSKTNYRVLIVDDDPEIANYIKSELSERYHCSICSNGKEALETVLKYPPHIVISDVLMPEMSGIELTKRMKANVNINHIPVVLVTALSDTQSNVEGLNVGAAAYLTKPFNVTLLKTTVDNIIQSRQRLKNVYEGKQTIEKKMPKTELQTPDERLMKRIMKIVEQHIFDHNLSVELLASEVGISRVHLNRKLKELTNQTTTDFIKNIRLKRAAELLGEKKHSIAEVADMVGFQNANNFSTAFRKLFGVSPREYMNQNHE
ncbi:MAG: response regulator, partial [Prevotella sp.]|nr:response regulator [Prevotella sp.]